MSQRSGIALGLLLGLLTAAPAVPSEPEEDEEHYRTIVSLVADRQQAVLEELTAFLALPNVSVDRDATRRNADHLRGMLERRGLTTRLLDADGAPYVFAHLAPEEISDERPALRILFYCHFDGQPVDPDRWTVTEPFSPRLVGEATDADARLYARSASDDNFHSLLE